MGKKQTVSANVRKKYKRCPFLAANIRTIDYKQTDLILKYTTQGGKILPRRITGVCAAMQRQLSVAIKRARLMALLPFVNQE